MKIFLSWQLNTKQHNPPHRGPAHLDRPLLLSCTAPWSPPWWALPQTSCSGGTTGAQEIQLTFSSKLAKSLSLQNVTCTCSKLGGASWRCFTIFTYFQGVGKGRRANPGTWCLGYYWDVARCWEASHQASCWVHRISKQSFEYRRLLCWKMSRGIGQKVMFYLEPSVPRGAVVGLLPAVRPDEVWQYARQI